MRLFKSAICPSTWWAHVSFSLFGVKRHFPGTRPAHAKNKNPSRTEFRLGLKGLSLSMRQRLNRLMYFI